MAENLWALIGAVVFLCLAFIDALGVQALIQNRYRGLPMTRTWQKKQSVLEAVVGVSGIAVCFVPEDLPMIYVPLGGAVIIAIVLIGVNNRTFRKKAAETEPLRQRNPAEL